MNVGAHDASREGDRLSKKHLLALVTAGGICERRYSAVRIPGRHKVARKQRAFGQNPLVTTSSSAFVHSIFETEKTQ